MQRITQHKVVSDTFVSLHDIKQVSELNIRNGAGTQQETAHLDGGVCMMAMVAEAGAPWECSRSIAAILAPQHQYHVAILMERCGQWQGEVARVSCGWRLVPKLPADESPLEECVGGPAFSHTKAPSRVCSGRLFVMIKPAGPTSSIDKVGRWLASEMHSTRHLEERRKLSSPRKKSSRVRSASCKSQE